MNINLDVITPENWRSFNMLRVKDEQQNFVPSNSTILARAFAYREYNSKVYAIYNDNKPIGILMQYDYKKDDKILCILNEFMIAEQYQGKGYGEAVLKLWISKIKKENKYDSILLSYILGNEAAGNLYLKLGFHYTGETDEDEIIMEYDLNAFL